MHVIDFLSSRKSGRKRYTDWVNLLQAMFSKCTLWWSILVAWNRCEGGMANQQRDCIHMSVRRYHVILLPWDRERAAWQGEGRTGASATCLEQVPFKASFDLKLNVRCFFIFLRWFYFHHFLCKFFSLNEYRANYSL